MGDQFSAATVSGSDDAVSMEVFELCEVVWGSCDFMRAFSRTCFPEQTQRRNAEDTLASFDEKSRV
jgi:hypothetical protein